MKKTIIYLILLILLVSSVSAGNVSINYGWNGTALFHSGWLVMGG